MPEAHKAAPEHKAPAKATAAKKEEAAAVAAMEHEGGPDPEVAKLKKELADLRAQTDERVERATKSEKLEKRPAITSDDPFSAAYDVDAEIRKQWPEIVLGDD